MPYNLVPRAILKLMKLTKVCLVCPMESLLCGDSTSWVDGLENLSSNGIKTICVQALQWCIKAK